MAYLRLGFLGGFTTPIGGKFSYNVGKTWKICNDSSIVEKYSGVYEIDGGYLTPSGNGALYFTISEDYRGYQLTGGDKFYIDLFLKDSDIPENAFSDIEELATVWISGDNASSSIGDYAFSGCADLEYVSINAAYDTIGDYAFSGCSKLDSISLDGSEPVISSNTFKDVAQGGIVHYNQVPINSTWLSVGEYYLGYYDWNGMDANGNLVNQTKIICKYTVPYRGTYDICYNTDSFIDILYNGESIGLVTKYDFPDSGVYTFEFVLTGKISDNAFFLCDKLTSITLSDAITSIGDKAFSECDGLTSFNITTNVSVIGDNPFYGCGSLSNLTVSEKNKIYKVVNGCLIENDTKLISTQYLETVEIPDSVTSIGDYAFGNTTLETIEIPNSVTSIGWYVFGSYNYNLLSITCLSSTAPETNEYTFRGVGTGGTLYYPEGADYSTWLSTEPSYLGYYGWNGVEIEVDEPEPDEPDEPTYNPSISILPQQQITIDSNAGNSYVDVTYTDIETIYPPEIYSYNGVFPTWLTLTTTTANDSDTIRYFFSYAENTGEAREATIGFSAKGTDGNIYNTSARIIQNKKEQETMASITIEGRYFNLEDGILYFDSTGGTKTLMARVEGYTAPYNFNVNITNGVNNKVELVSSSLYFDDGNGYLEWLFEIKSQGNVSTKSYEGTIEIEYTDGTGSYKSEVPYYVYRYGEGWIKLNQATDFEYDMNGNNINSIRRDYVAVRYFNIATINTPITSTWIGLSSPTIDEATSDGSVIYKYPVLIAENGGEERTGSVIFSGKDKNGKTVSVTQFFRQDGYSVEPEPDEPEPDEPEFPSDSDAETYSPIWKDIYYEFTYDTAYSIYEEVQVYVNQGVGTIKQEKLIYSGKVYVPPTNNVVEVMINKVCQNYFADNSLPEDNYVGQYHNFKKFILRGDYGQKLHTYYFVNDWSYEPLTVGLKTNPIIPCIVDGQRLFFSVFSDSTQRGYKWGMKYYDGTADYDNTEYVKNDFASVFVLPSRYKGVKQFYFGDRQYNMIPKCKAQYVLYYINPNGGWDWFPVMGRVSKTDSVTQYTYTNNYDNNTRQFGKYRYLTEVSTRYNLNTGFLTEKQSDRMWELLESNCVYLHNVVDDKIFPVIITNNEIEYKKKERGKKMLTYSINVESSQTRERI